MDILFLWDVSFAIVNIRFKYCQIPILKSYVKCTVKPEHSNITTPTVVSSTLPRLLLSPQPYHALLPTVITATLPRLLISLLPLLTLIIILKNIDFKTFDLSEVSKLKGSSSGFHKGRFTQGIAVLVAEKTISHPHSLIQKGRKTIFILLVIKLSLDAVLYLIL